MANLRQDTWSLRREQHGRKGKPEDPDNAPEDDTDSASGAYQSQEEDEDDSGCDPSCDACRGAEKTSSGDESSEEAGDNETDADCGGGDGEAGERAHVGDSDGEDGDRADSGGDDGGSTSGQDDAGDQYNETGIQTLDDHGRWQEIAADEPLARSLIESAMEEAAERRGELSEEEEAVLEAASKGWGIDPGRIKSLTEPERREAKVNWRHELRRYVGRELDRSPSYSRPPRRYPHLVGIVPGVVRRAARPRILAVVDTSASISGPMLNEFCEELHHIAKGREVWWADCDTEVRGVHRWGREPAAVEGRGGTDFRPPLERKFLRKHRVDLVIYLTDGYGPAPEREPQVPVVWLLTPGGEPPAPWGKTISMG